MGGFCVLISKLILFVAFGLVLQVHLEFFQVILALKELLGDL